MRILPAIVVFGAAGAGYVYHQEQAGQTAPLSKLVSTGSSWVSAVIGEDSDDDNGSIAVKTASLETTDGEPAPDAAVSDELNLSNIIRFDITSEQLRQSSNRISVKPEGRLRSYRLPLVTGNSPQDLSGSLVYFFEGDVVRRITFLGSTGDSRPLVEYLRRQFGFQRANSRNPHVETYSVRTNFSGLLKISPAETPEARSQIDLSIAR